MALNCNTDLGWYKHIVPCGIEGKGVTSLSEQLDREVTIDGIVPHFIEAFSDIFQCRYVFEPVEEEFLAQFREEESARFESEKAKL